MKFFEIIKGIFVSKQFKRFVWTVLDSFLAYLVVYFTQINVLWILPMIGGFQLLTKELNTKIGAAIAGRKKG